MHWLRFLIFNAIGAALWVGTWVTIGYFAGNNITTVYHYITLYSYYVLAGAGGADRGVHRLAPPPPAAPRGRGRGQPDG